MTLRCTVPSFRLDDGRDRQAAHRNRGAHRLPRPHRLNVPDRAVRVHRVHHLLSIGVVRRADHAHAAFAYVPAIYAATFGTAGRVAVEALAVLLQAVALAALAARQVALGVAIRVLAHARLEGHGVLLDGQLHGLATRWVVLVTIRAVVASAAVAQATNFEAVTVQLQASCFLAFARNRCGDSIGHQAAHIESRRVLAVCRHDWLPVVVVSSSARGSKRSVDFRRLTFLDLVSMVRRRRQLQKDARSVSIGSDRIVRVHVARIGELQFWLLSALLAVSSVLVRRGVVRAVVVIINSSWLFGKRDIFFATRFLGFSTTRLRCAAVERRIDVVSVRDRAPLRAVEQVCERAFAVAAVD